MIAKETMAKIEELKDLSPIKGVSDDCVIWCALRLYQEAKYGCKITKAGEMK